MDSRFIDRSIGASFSTAAVLYVFLIPHFSFAVVGGLFVGILLSIFNLWMLSRLFEAFLAAKFDKKKIAYYLGLKFPVFYSLAIFVFYYGPFSLGALAIGFNFPFLVIVLKAAGRVILGERFFFQSRYSEN